MEQSTINNRGGVCEDYLASLSFGELLAHARRMKGLSQKKLAEKLKVKQNIISHYENDKRKPSVAVIAVLSFHLNFSLPRFLTAYRKTYYASLNHYDLGSVIKTERKLLGYPLKTLSEQTGVSVNRLRRFEANKTIPNQEELNKIAAACQSEKLPEYEKRMFK